MISKLSPLAILGAGVFAEMIVKAILQNKILKPQEIIATVRRTSQAKHLKKKFGITVQKDNKNAVKNAEIILVSVRPNQVVELATSLPAELLQGKPVVSVVAGVPLDRSAFS